MNDSSHLVLVVDDDPDIRDAISEILEREGYRVVTVENGRAALEYLRAGDRPSMILLDMMMPVMNGWQFRRQQQEDPSIQRIPVVMITASEERRADLIPNHQVLTKPILVHELLKVVHQLLLTDAGPLVPQRAGAPEQAGFSLVVLAENTSSTGIRPLALCIDDEGHRPPAVRPLRRAAAQEQAQLWASPTKERWHRERW